MAAAVPAIGKAMAEAEELLQVLEAAKDGIAGYLEGQGAPGAQAGGGRRKARPQPRTTEGAQPVGVLVVGGLVAPDKQTPARRHALNEKPTRHASRMRRNGSGPPNRASFEPEPVRTAAEHHCLIRPSKEFRPCA